MSEWQPIETARKDRKSILVWCPGNKCQYMVTWDDDGWFVFGSFTKLTRLVTHWRELPSSPEVEPQPQQPLRWVENCKPDKPGIWAGQDVNGEIYVTLIDQSNMAARVARWIFKAACYVGPMPEILPPMKKVVERLWLEPIKRTAQNAMEFEEAWFVDGETMQPPGDWISTDRTREREI